MSGNVLNIAAYQFVSIDDAAALQPVLFAAASDAVLKGTILLAHEGINLFLAGPPTGMAQFLQKLRSDPRFATLAVKESWSERVPFKRLRVRCKREIIRMNHPTIRPEQGRAAAVDAVTLKRWLDQGCDDTGRPLMLLDTRNTFEIQTGRFAGAVALGINKFSEFPAAVRAATASLEGKTVVSYCTGGIRCEKAALYMNEIGLTNHWQLEGGILKYFEVVGGAYFEGQCTVFDERLALDASLSE
jgi:UPF0176 protein